MAARHSSPEFLPWLLLFPFAAIASCQQSVAEAPGGVSFCGAPEIRHQVVRLPERSLPGPLAPGKTRLNLFWRGSRARVWKGVQCRVSLNGVWIAVLSKNTYSTVDVEPGRLRLCAGGTAWPHSELPATWRSLMFLHAAPGEEHYLECSPGGDNVGRPNPTLAELPAAEGRRVISRHALVHFTENPEP